VVKAINQACLGHIICTGPGKGCHVDCHDRSTVAGPLPPKDHPRSLAAPATGDNRVSRHVDLKHITQVPLQY
jgi:hypothetical protein